ncbi:glycine zipper 2TM domain-containing protein [Scleromatobacter humisilvae]|uniref:Glycine zipper 2TM domain-containing protein n=1 Tax=Scleromatobacter humisilvae TaxID=2897159 RepID=A0A9X1YFW1_9BURK|nr:glycine zipper 2TM domain-containing protein [Scleromatobacter humisilvae]MCK9684927.1 glycine zipper 2TM domain-containing protein [Scleromatobacter humisilvae]
MSNTTPRLRAFQLAVIASAAVALGACSKNDADVAPPVAATSAPAQVATAPVPAPVATTPAPVVVAQNSNAYEQGRRDQQRQDVRHDRDGRTLHEPPPRADRDTEVVDQQRWRHDQQIAAATCRECGVVESVAAVKVQGQTNGVGAVAGGLGGALVGNRIAGRHDRTLGGVVGAVGGGLLGNAIEKHERTTTVFDVSVRMDDGTLRTVRESTSPAVGEKVRVEADGLHART